MPNSGSKKKGGGENAHWKNSGEVPNNKTAQKKEKRLDVCMNKPRKFQGCHPGSDFWGQCIPFPSSKY